MGYRDAVERLTDKQLRDLSRTTLAHYDAEAAAFWQGTRDHDVSQNIDALLGAIPGPPPYEILDLGCGPGRDLAAFKKKGHRPIGLDGSETFAAMARAHAGCEVWVQDFLALALPAEHFDGIFANASLFHVPGQEIVRVLGELRDALRPQGVLFASNPHGANQEGWNGSRYGCFHDLAHWQACAAAAGLEEISHYYRPAGLPRSDQPWLASVWRRAGT